MRTYSGHASITETPISAKSAAMDALSLRSAWSALIADLNMICGETPLTAKPNGLVPYIQTDNSWAKFSGKARNGSFNVFLPIQLADDILKAQDANLAFSSLLSEDAALVFEHIFSNKLGALEEAIGTNLALDKSTTVTVPVIGTLLGLDIEFAGKSYSAAIQTDGAFATQINSSIEANSSPEESKISSELSIHFGPIVLASKVARQAKPGETINCGVAPNDLISGVLMRKDGAYWPIHVEDDAIEIIADLVKPDQNTRPQYDRVFVTFVIGTVELSAFERQQLAAGKQININRFENNHVDIFYQNKPFAKGHLKLVDGYLAVEYDEINTSVKQGN